MDITEAQKLQAQARAIEEILRQIRMQFGVDFLREDARLTAVFADLAPKLERERKLLRAFLSCHGNTILLEAQRLPEAESRFRFDQLVHVMCDDLFLTDEAARMVSSAFAAALLEEGRYVYSFREQSPPKQTSAPRQNTSANRKSDVYHYTGSHLYTKRVRTQRQPTPAMTKEWTERFFECFLREELACIEILPSLSAVPAHHVDLSEQRNGSVLGWLSGDPGSYTLHIAGRGGVAAPADSFGLFQDCTGLRSFRGSSCFDTSNIEDMGFMFCNCGSLSDLDVSDWNTAKVTSMGFLFDRCRSLTALDVSRWNVSQVTNFSLMFRNCESLTQLDVSQWNTAKAEDLSLMFEGCRRLTALDVSRWNTAQVNTMRQMFLDCTGLPGLDVSRWDTGRVKNMAMMFSGCRNLVWLDVSRWNTAQVTDMKIMFQDCERLYALDLSGWNTAKVTEKDRMFQNCPAGDLVRL